MIYFKKFEFIYEMLDVNKVRVISDFIVFFPKDCPNEDGLTFINALKFVEQCFDEKIHYLVDESFITLFKNYNDVIFLITANKNYETNFLLKILKNLKEISLFLFGKNFSDYMTKNINVKLMDLYSLYINKYFWLVENNISFLFNVVPFSFVTSTLNFNHSIFKELNVKNILVYNDKLEIIYLLYNCLSNDSLFCISLLLHIEHENLTKSIFCKNAFLNFNDDNYQKYTLVASKLGARFFIAILKPSDINESLKSSMINLFKNMNDNLSISLFLDWDRININKIYGLLYCVFINRSKNQIIDFTSSTNSKFIDKVSQIKFKLSNILIASVFSGIYFAIENEMILQYSYQLIYTDHNNIVIPTTKSIPVDIEVSNVYKYIRDNLYEENEYIKCYELLTVYNGSLSKDIVVSSNNILLSNFLRSLTDKFP